MSKPEDIPQDAVLDLIEEGKREHQAIHDRLRTALVGRRVKLKGAINGIKGREGVIADIIMTYDVSVGVDVDRLDGRPGRLDRLWFGMRSVTLHPSSPEAV